MAGPTIGLYLRYPVKYAPTEIVADR